MRGGFTVFMQSFSMYPLNPYKTLKVLHKFRAKVERVFYYFQDSNPQNSGFLVI